MTFAQTLERLFFAPYLLPLLLLELSNFIDIIIQFIRSPSPNQPSKMPAHAFSLLSWSGGAFAVSKNTRLARNSASFADGRTSPTMRKNNKNNGYNTTNNIFTRKGSAVLESSPSSPTSGGSSSSTSSSSLPLVVSRPRRRAATFRRSRACRRSLGSAASDNMTSSADVPPSVTSGNEVSRGSQCGVECGEPDAT